MEIRPRAALLLLALCIATCATPGTSAEDDALQDAYELAADLPAQHPLRPYDATYKTSVAGLSITLQRSLSVDDSGHCSLTSKGSLLVAGISEVSVFRVDDVEVIPQSYVYRLNYGPVNRRREVRFDEETDVIRSLYKKTWYELPKAPGTLDRMSQQEQLRLLLLNDPSPRQDIRLRVADGRKVKHYVFRYLEDEVIDTPMGAVRTMRFEREHSNPEERQSYFWVAPAWDYLMVRTVHVEDGTTTEANLIDATIDGDPVRGDAAG